jgi:hypothetical protein
MILALIRRSLGFELFLRDLSQVNSEDYDREDTLFHVSRRSVRLAVFLLYHKSAEGSRQSLQR